MWLWGCEFDPDRAYQSTMVNLLAALVVFMACHSCFATRLERSGVSEKWWCGLRGEDTEWDRKKPTNLIRYYTA